MKCLYVCVLRVRRNILVIYPLVNENTRTVANNTQLEISLKRGPIGNQKKVSKYAIIPHKIYTANHSKSTITLR